MRATKKTSKKNIAGKIFFISQNSLGFCPEFFLSHEIDWFFFEKRQQSNACAGQKKTHVFFGNARPESNARAHLKHRKKHSGLTMCNLFFSQESKLCCVSSELCTFPELQHTSL